AGFAVLEWFAEAPGEPASRSELLIACQMAHARIDSVDSVVARVQAAMGTYGSTLVVPADDGFRFAIEELGLIAVGKLLLDPAACAARLGDCEQQLAPALSRILAVLMAARGGVVRREELCAAAGCEARRLQAYLSRLQSKLRELSGDSKL